jgi:DNA-binding NarL/FixJ family response regulator
MHNEARNVAVALRRRLDVDILSRELATTLRCHVALATTEIKSATSLIRSRGAQAHILDANFPRESLNQAVQAFQDSAGKQALLLLDDVYSPHRAQFAESIPVAYCSRDISLPELNDVVERLLKDGAEAPSTSNGLIQSGRRTRIDHPIAAELTDRELEVILLLSEGRSVKECAELLNLAESTIENHKFRLMRKLGVHRFTDVLRIAFRAGLISA